MNIFNKTYDNGLRLVFEKTQSNVIGVNFLFNVGSRNETKSEEGLSHFVEHLMFKTSRKFTTEEIMDKLTFYGADFNAYTSKIMTRYVFKCLSENFEKCFEIYSDMLIFPKLFDDEIDKERNVVVEEMKKFADSPSEVAYENVMNNFYHGQSYAHDELGSESIIMNVSRDTLLNYKNKHYTADNCIISIVGNLDFDEVDRVVKTYFADEFLVKTKPKELNKTELLPSIAKKINVIERPDNQANVCIRIAGTTKNKEVAEIYVSILGSSQNSRLYKVIREELGLVYSIYAVSDSNYLMGSIVIMFGTRPKNVVKAVKKIKQILKELAEGGISEEELERAKNWRKSVLEFASETSSDKAETNGSQANVYGKVISKDEKVKRLEAVSLEDVTNYAKRIYEEENYCLTAVGKGLEEKNLKF